jgi:hypothetical protein
MEQLPDACFRRRGLSEGKLSGMAVEDNVFWPHPLIRNPRMSGAPGEIDKAQRVFLLLAHLSGDVVAELLLDILLGLGIEVG